MYLIPRISAIREKRLEANLSQHMERLRCEMKEMRTEIRSMSEDVKEIKENCIRREEFLQSQLKLESKMDKLMEFLMKGGN